LITVADDVQVYKSVHLIRASAITPVIYNLRF
jgi:hypothetical protein